MSRWIDVKKTLILLAGPPGTGKSYFGHLLMEEVPHIQLVSPDDIREKLFDRVGFDDLAEKARLTDRAWDEYYDALSLAMRESVLVMSDYPFSYKQKSKLQDLSKRYGYRTITIRLAASLEILFQRQKERDLDPSRHRGHIFSHYHKNDPEPDRSTADDLDSFEVFRARCMDRNYMGFEMGDLLEIDVTNFQTANYPEALKQVKELLDA